MINLLFASSSVITSRFYLLIVFLLFGAGCGSQYGADLSYKDNAFMPDVSQGENCNDQEIVSANPVAEGDYIWSIPCNYKDGAVVDPLGNTYVTRTSVDEVEEDGVIVEETKKVVLEKYDASGDLLWRKAHEVYTEDNVLAVAVSSNALYRAGYRWYGTYADMVLSKYDLNGDMDTGFGSEGTIYYSDGGSAGGYAVAIDSNGYVYVAGDRYSSKGSYDEKLFLRKYDPAGAFIEANIYDTNGKYAGAGIAVDSQGYIYLTADISKNMYMVKINPSGLSEEWHREYDGGLDTGGVAIAIDSSDNIYVTGYQGRSLNIAGTTTASDTFLRKYDPAGNHLGKRNMIAGIAITAVG